ncbi:mediator complex subunit 13 C-terminal-domain-containing protein [Roridomyces roridus]|uniref:Mediator of RNA polymerase II transcription subunit 13 n=1 Tax=Roridomyces roridus TaxID=1738132 RepID=A0AAD7CGE5_9AGAR|nr:mediator complex subunit 13 C-terminal-domain-containing protein [Roridomyces roridus]
MAAKTPSPRLAASDKLLSSTISLPEDALISCTVYSPIAGPSSQSRAYNDILEIARRDVISQNGSATLAQSILTSVHASGSDSCMYAFSIGQVGLPPAELSRLQFDGLTVTSQASFTPADIFPCHSCADLATPCPSCLDPNSPPQQLPRHPLRLIYSHFLEAVRLRVIADISAASNAKQSGRKRLVKRLKGGFLLDPPPSSTEWSKGWDMHASSRPLIFCQLQIHLAPSQLIIHPQLHTTPFLLLPHGPGRPLQEGAPITLLPHGTPAFYLASYSGPTSALRRQFRDSLAGMGVCGWDAEEGADDSWFSSKTHQDRRETKFIIAWISVENKQGEDKGIPIIYPASLCLSFAPSATSGLACAPGRREPLAYIPDLPPQLQPSPQVTAALPTASDLPAAVTSHLPPAIRSSSCPSTPSPHALRAFRALTLSRSRGVRHVADEVNGYVDAVAREREKERERLRREREREGGSPRLSRANTSGPTVTPAATPAAVPPVTPQFTPAVVPPPPPQPTPIPSQPPSNFYPSPPQVDPPFTLPTEDRTSPEVADPPPVSAPVVPPPAIVPAAQVVSQPAPPATYDPFDTSYMDIDMAMNSFGVDMDVGMMGMGMNFGMGMNGGQQRGGGMDFDADFTDDDFSFFDRVPVASAPLSVPILPEPHPGAGLTPAAGPTPLGIGGMLGMSPPLFGESPAPHSLTGDWVAGAGVFTPGPDMQHLLSVPDLLPPSPGETPNSQAASMPATPNVQLAGEDEQRVLVVHTGGLAHGIFDPIPFAASHRVADGKYVMGKFALPSPPPEVDEQVNYFEPSAKTQDNWRFKYASVTDPRIGVVRKLIGVKRKTSCLGLAVRNMSPSWVQEHEEWERRRAAVEEETKSEPESEEEDMEEADSPLASRPSTPPPAYLPLGPTLLHTHFQHSCLLPLSTPLRPPGAAVAPTNITTLASASVPTPVSPAALLGAASEKSKSLEAAAFAVGREFVENSVWAEAWRTTAINKHPNARDGVWPADVQTVAQLLQLVPYLQEPFDLQSLFGLDSSSSSAIQTFEPPMISVGKADAVVQILPTALRFWEKLGLTPRGGRKNATVFVLFDDDGGGVRQPLAENWLAKIAAVYGSKHLGTLTPGSHGMCVKDGVFPLRFDSTFRKNLASFVAGLARSDSNLIFYVVTPLSTMSLASPLLRQVFSSVKKALKSHDETQMLFHFVPEALVVCPTGINPAVQLADLEAACHATYDRILQPVDRVMARRFFEHGEPVRRYFQDPAYALARPLHTTVKYVKRTKAPLDVTDAGTLLHVGYALSACGKWILAACVDERGEAHELAVWLTQTHMQPVGVDGEEQEGEPETLTHEEYAARKVWEFACQFAQRVNVAWRIVISKLGAISVADLDAWTYFLAKAFPASSLPDLHVALLSVEPDAPWTFLPTDVHPKTPTPTPAAPAGASTPLPGNSKLHPSLPSKPVSRAPSSSTKPSSFYVDISSTTYAFFPTRHLPIAFPPVPADLGLTMPLVPESAPIPPTSATSPMSESASPQSSIHGTTAPDYYPHPLAIRPRTSALLVRVPAASVASTPSILQIGMLAAFPSDFDAAADEGLMKDITRSFHSLSVLASARWRLAQAVDPILPFHLAAVEAMRSALERDGGAVV